MIGYIDRYSWKCLLGKMSRNIEENDLYATWTVGKVRHVDLFQPLKDLDILKSLVPFNFHYFSQDDLDFISSQFRVKKSKCASICLDLEKTLNPTGKKYRGLRNRINRMKKLDIEVLDNYKNIEDIEGFVDYWSDHYSLKYFRDYSSKNLFFYKSNFHLGCVNSFCYEKDKLVAYGTASPSVNEYSVYIIGKAFYEENPILSEFLDFSLYRKLYKSGGRYVNLGGSFTKKLLAYKSKFPGAQKFIEFEGKIKDKE